MKHLLFSSLTILLAVSSSACSPPARSAHEAERAEHDEAPDPRLQDPRVIAAAARIRVLPGALECPVEVLGLVDVHEPMKTNAEGLELLKRRAALLDAEAIVGVEFEHGEGGAEKTHLSGTAVRCNDLLEGQKYDVLGEVTVTGEMEHEDEALRSLQRRATTMGANLVVNIRFEHGDSERTKITGTAVHAYRPSEGRVFGSAHVFGNLAVYPVTVSSRSQTDVGPLWGLDDALAGDAADVREQGTGSVNTILIENKSAVPIFVLAGSVLVGGKQDRQIGQDYIIDANATSPVDAFCLEHGRWNTQREGAATGGRFRTAEVVAPSKLRAAGQYKRSQGEVWSKVGESNAVHGKASESGTFLATVDDPAITKERRELASRIEAVLGAVKPQDDVVGIAYAVDGEIRGVRWFAHHKVFAIVEKKLVNGIALEALTAKAESASRSRPEAGKPPPLPSAVESFVKNVESEAVKEQRDTSAANKNEYKETVGAYGSKTMLRVSPRSPSAARAIQVSSDFTAK